MTPLSTAVPAIPRFQLPSDEENAESYRIFQTYYSNFPFLEEAPHVYKERWGCVGRMDFFGVFNYNTQYTIEEGRQAFIRYLQQTKWEYTEHKYDRSDDGWTRIRFQASMEATQEPYLAFLWVNLTKWGAIPTEYAESVSDEVNKYYTTHVHITVIHLESLDPVQYPDSFEGDFIEFCNGEWWLQW